MSQLTCGVARSRPKPQQRHPEQKEGRQLTSCMTPNPVHERFLSFASVCI